MGNATLPARPAPRVRWTGRAIALLLGLLALLVAAIAAWNLQSDADDDRAPPPVATPERLAHGAYLARAGNCAGCHTARGGAPYAGGRGLATPFGTVYAGNLTPDATGLGGWTAADFRRALRQGRGRDGRLLVPAFPYTHFTRLARDDVDALFLHLQAQRPVARPNTPHALRFPFDTTAALAVWRALYFRPGPLPADPALDAPRQRGRYLVDALGHCSACHGARNPLGASTGLADGPGGAPLPGSPWYAPSLTDRHEAGLAGWPMDDAVALLKTGTSPRGVVHGPMAEVVAGSTQHLHNDDLRAMVAWLQALPAHDRPPPRGEARDPQALRRGAELYRQHCADCHGDQGQGAPGAYPALAGNRLVTMARPGNLVLAVTRGGFAPGTAGHPRPYGMPPFDLDDADLAALLTWLRAAWGHDAPAISAVDVLIAR